MDTRPMTRTRSEDGSSRLRASPGLPRAVLWDLDGTLVDSAADIASALNALLLAHGLETYSVKRIKTMIGGGIERLVERGWAAHGEALRSRQIDQLSTRFLELYAQRATDETRLFDGVEDVLHELRRLGVSQAVCTNKPRAISESILQRLEVGELFDAVVGGDCTTEKKPHPLPVISGLQRLRVANTDAVMVGDSGADVTAGHAAGVRVVLVRQGYSDKPVDGLGAEAVIDGVSDLFDALAVLPCTA